MKELTENQKKNIEKLRRLRKQLAIDSNERLKKAKEREEGKKD